MLNFFVISVLHNKKNNKQVPMKDIKKNNNDTNYKLSNKGYCEYCGQRMPWFCVCYLNKKKQI